MIANKKGNIAKVVRGIEKDWFIVGYSSTGFRGLLYIGNVYFPKHFIGKKIRIKVEVVEEAENEL